MNEKRPTITFAFFFFSRSKRHINIKVHLSKTSKTYNNEKRPSNTFAVVLSPDCRFAIARIKYV